MWTKESRAKWREDNKKYLAEYRKNDYLKNKEKYRKRALTNYYRHKKKIIKKQMEWNKKNNDKCKIHQKRYYDKNSKILCDKVKLWQRSVSGKKWFKKYYHSESHYASIKKYFEANKMKWNRYRYKWILKGLDVHEKNKRIAHVIMWNINKLSQYKLKKSDIYMHSNGQVDLRIKVPNKMMLNKIKEQSIYWHENFNEYNNTRVNLKIKNRMGNKFDILMSVK